jgi:hypothetical protein
MISAPSHKNHPIIQIVCNSMLNYAQIIIIWIMGLSAIC